MRLIVIEGVDGAGKSTQIKLLREHLTGMGYKCEYLHFPRVETPYFGELIARFLRGEFGSLSEVDPYIVAMLYAGDRKDASGIIGDWLKAGKFVLLDRYTYSNIAYQCAKLIETKDRNELRRWIMSLEFNHFAIPEPDLNIFLDVPFTFTEKKLTSPRAGDDRTYLNGNRDIHEESMLFQKTVRDIYISVAETDKRLAVIDCRNSEGGMYDQNKIFQLIIKLLTERKII